MTRADAELIRLSVLIAAGATSFDVIGLSERARALGSTAVELTAGSAPASADWDTLRASLSANNLLCAGLALDQDDTNLGASDAGSRSKARDRIVSAIHDASRMGASYVRVVAARLDVANARIEDAHHHSLEALLALRHEAGLNGISIVMHLAEHGFLTSPTEARQFLDAVNSPWVGGAINLAACGSSSLATDWINTLTHRLRVVHMENSTAVELDWSAIGCALAAERFDGFIVAPFEATHDIDNRLITIQAAIDAVQPRV